MKSTLGQIDREMDAEKQAIVLMRATIRWCCFLAACGATLYLGYELFWESSATRISAQVVAFEKKDESSEFAVFEFSVDGREFRGRIAPQRGDFRPALALGAKVPVLYQPTRPSSFVRDNVESRFWPSFVLCFVAFLCFVGLMASSSEIQRLEDVRSERKSALDK